MELKVIKGNFTICKVEDMSGINFESEYCFFERTDEELSLICKEEDVPQNVTIREDGWNCIRIQGILDFSLIGILSKILTVLAENKIGIATISTYNTDYVFTKKENFEKALNVLEKAGYEIIQ